MPQRITYAVAKDFFESLEDNEQHMGEGAALGVTLSEFGYGDDEFDVLAEMAEAFEAGPPRRSKGRK